MCGRYASFRDDQALADEFAIARVADDVRLLPPSWNVAPTDPVRIVVERPERTDPTPSPVRSLQLARWGLVPSWAKDPAIGNRMINARVETVANKPAFARALSRRRCLVPADGYFEWQAVDGAAAGGRRAPKQPYYIHPVGGGSLALAGLYEFWRDPTRDDEDPQRWVVSMTILTEPASGDLRELHDRQPVMLAPEVWDTWLDPALEDARLAHELLGTPGPLVRAVPVSRAVNKVGTNGPELIEPIEPEPEPGEVPLFE